MNEQQELEFDREACPECKGDKNCVFCSGTGSGCVMCGMRGWCASCNGHGTIAVEPILDPLKVLK